MEITRGAIVLAAGPGDYAGRPRPYLVVQSDAFNPTHSSITLCPLTSVIGGEALFRVAFSPSTETGLREESEAQIDKLQTFRRARVRETIGQASDVSMEQVDQALRRWLSL